MNYQTLVMFFILGMDLLLKKYIKVIYKLKNLNLDIKFGDVVSTMFTDYDWMNPITQRKASIKWLVDIGFLE